MNVSQRSGSKYGWLVLGLLWAIDLLNNYTAFSLGVMLPLMKEDLGISPIQAGLLGSSYFIGFAVGGLPASVWLSRFSPRLITLVFSILGGGLLLLQGWSPNLWVLLVGRFLFVLLSIGRLPSEVILIHQWFNPRTYALANGITFAVIALGQCLGFGATPFMMEVLGGWRGVYFLVGALLLVLAAVWFFLGRERLPAPGSSAHISPNQDGAASPLREVIRRPVIWLISSTQIGPAIAFGAFFTFWPTFAIEDRGMVLSQAGPILSIYSFGGILGAFSSGPLCDFLRRRKPLIWSAGLALPILYLGILQVDQEWAVPLIFLGMGFFSFIVIPVLVTIPFDMGMRSREIAIVWGLMRTFTSTSAGIGPLLVGGMVETYGSLYLGLAVTIPSAFLMAIWGILLPETWRRRQVGGSGYGREQADTVENP